MYIFKNKDLLGYRIVLKKIASSFDVYLYQWSSISANFFIDRWCRKYIIIYLFIRMKLSLITL